MNTKEMIEVMQAFEDGKEVQSRYSESELGADWFEASDPCWDWDEFEYRIKPEPKEVWVNEYDGLRPVAYLTKADANFSSGEPTRTSVLYREVL